MTDTDRLAALLEATFEEHDFRIELAGPGPDGEVILSRADALRWIAARLIAQGVRVGDPPPPADDAGGLRAAALNLIAHSIPVARYVRVDRSYFGDLQIALAAQPAPPALDRERPGWCGSVYPGKADWVCHRKAGHRGMHATIGQGVQWDPVP